MFVQAPYYSLHEELGNGRVECVAATSTLNGAAQLHVHFSVSEKRVLAERSSARKQERQRLEQAKRSSPQMKARLSELRHPVAETHRNVMVLHPNDTLDYGQLIDVRSETIGHAILATDEQARASGVEGVDGLAPDVKRYNREGISLAEWWEKASAGNCRWGVSARCSVRVAVVKLHRPPMFAFFPADQVWRSEAYVPWEVATSAATAAAAAASGAGGSGSETRNDMMDVQQPQAAAAAAASSSSAAAALSGGAAAAAASSSSPAPCGSMPFLPPVAPHHASLTHTFSVRDSFIAAPGYVLLSVDYSNIELRMMAHFSNDPTLVDLFKKQGTRLFESTACACFRN